MASWHSVIPRPLQSWLKQGLNHLNDRLGAAQGEELPLGMVLDNRYKIEAVLGRGAFGRVYQVAHLGRGNETWALKEFVPQKEWVGDVGKAQELFEREGKVLLQLQHPQIPRFLETLSIVHQGQLRFFLVQEYIAGKTYEFIRKTQYSQGMPEDLVQQLLIDLLPVLSYLHTQKIPIFHRDITPDNIIQCQNTGQPKLIDFGAVKATFTKISGGQIHTRIGKPGYAAPEQLLGKSVDATCDVYGLGVTAIVLLTGRSPHHLQRKDEWCWEEFLSQSLNPHFVTIVNQMIAPQKSDRFASAQAVLQALYSLKPQENFSPTPDPLQLAKKHCPVSVVHPNPPPLISTPMPVPRSNGRKTAKTIAIGCRDSFSLIQPPSLPEINLLDFVKKQALWVGGLATLIIVFFAIGNWIQQWSSGSSDRSVAGTDSPVTETTTNPTECDRFGQLHEEKGFPDIMTEVNDRFWAEYPELKDKTLAENDSRAEEWCAIGNNVLSAN